MENVKRKKKGRPKTIYKTPGRKSKLTYELINEIEDLIKQGYTVRDTCAVIDISETAFYGWINIAEEIINSDDELAISEGAIYIELVKTLKRADAERKNAIKQKIERHGNKQWQALAWLLERSYPQEFGKQDNLDIGFKQDANKVTLQTLNALKEREVLNDELDSNEEAA